MIVEYMIFKSSANFEIMLFHLMSMSLRLSPLPRGVERGEIGAKNAEFEICILSHLQGLGNRVMAIPIAAETGRRARF